jgi:conjugative transfer signal peptidase TraF
VRCLRGLATGLLVGGLGIGVQWLFGVSGLWINVTRSLPIGLYRMVREPVRRGSYVIVCPPAWAGALARARGYLWRGPCPGRVARLGKQVIAVAGDTVELTDSGFTVNGQRVPHSTPLTQDARGRLLPTLRGHWVVSPTGVWLWAGWNARSFDSRYFGPISTSDIRAAVRPLINSAQP